MLTDSFGRKINYLRLAVIDRCNLRCTYCMPENGLAWIPGGELMTTTEMLRLCRLFTEMGVDKVRITGGEPFMRRDLLPLLENISRLPGLRELTLTTNGLLTEPFIPQMKALGVRSVNISLDTLDEERFSGITRRTGLHKVLATIHTLLAHRINVKINCVVMDGQNTEDILPLVRLAKKLPVDVRFIEEMPFNGTDEPVSLKWDFPRILEHIRNHFPDIEKIPDPAYSTSFNYRIPGFTGNIGIIAAHTRSFCGSCNRLRLTPAGILRTCLYEASGENLKAELRAGRSDAELKEIIFRAVRKKPKDGWEAEKLTPTPVHESMATIGG